MPNNLIFNNSAESLKVQVYGVTSGATVTGLLVDGSGYLQVAGTVNATLAGGTVSVTANDFDIRTLTSADQVTLAGGTVSVNIRTLTSADQVTLAGGTVSVTANSFDIRTLTSADQVTLAGGTVSVTANSFDIRTLTSADQVTLAGGTVSVTANSFDIRSLSQASDTISFGTHGFTSSSLTITSTEIGFTSTAFYIDTSQIKDYSFYVYNSSQTATVSVRLQVSPTTTDSYFANDTTAQILAGASSLNVLVPGYFMNYTRLQILKTSANTCTLELYFNGQY